MKTLFAFIIGVLVGLGVWDVKTGDAWGGTLLVAAFIVGVTFLSLHNSAWFEDRAREAKRGQEEWAISCLARMLVEWERPEVEDGIPWAAWSSEQVIEWWNEHRYQVGPEALSASRWRLRRRLQTEKRERWIAAYVEGLAAEEAKHLGTRLESRIEWIREQDTGGSRDWIEWLRELDSKGSVVFVPRSTEAPSPGPPLPPREGEPN